MILFYVISNLILIGNIIWVLMMYKYVLIHQPNLVSLYALGRWVIYMLLANPFPWRRLLVVV
jgi:hypothetical protein